MPSPYATISRTAEPTLNFCVKRRRAGVGFGDGRGNQQRDGGQEQQAGLQAGADAVVFLHVMLQPAEKKRRPEHEQRVGDDGAGDGRLDQHVFARRATRPAR